MCFFYSLPKKPKEIAKRYDRQLSLFNENEMGGKYLIKGYDHSKNNFIITAEKQIQVASWGLVPFWSKTKEDVEEIWKENRNVNAKEETIFTLPSFRFPIKKHRCLVPASGWFEYHYEKGVVKDIYYIYVKDTDIYSFAGIYDVWHDKNKGEDVLSYAVITTEANKLMHFIHNGGKNPSRMPVVLRREDEAKWLNPDTTQEELKRLMQPFPDELMDAYPIDKDSKEFRNSDSFDPDILNKA